VLGGDYNPPRQDGAARSNGAKRSDGPGHRL